MLYLCKHVRSTGFEIEPAEFILKVSKQSYTSRMSGTWPHWDSIPPHIKNVILADVLVSIYLFYY